MARTLLMTDLIPAGLPPWLVPLLIVSVAMAVVLLIPALRSFSKAGANPVNAFWLLLPVVGLVIVAILMMKRVMPVAGKPKLLALLVIVPLVNVMFLWMFAFGAWSEGASSGVDRRTARRREAKTGEAQRETPTLSGSPETLDVQTAGAGTPAAAMVEPTLQADAGIKFDAAGTSQDTMTGPSLSAAQSTSGSIGDAKGDAPVAAATADRDADADVDSGADSGDQTIVAGAAGPAVIAGTLSKGRTKIAARTGDDEPDSKDAKTQRPDAADYDLIGAGDLDGFGQDAAEKDVPGDDAYDEDGEPVGESGAGTPDGTGGDGGGQAVAGESVSEEDMTLAEGVLDDLQQGAKDPTEPPAVTAQPLTDGAQDRVWLVQGVNARAANIEASIREEDISRSVTGILVGRSNRADFIIDDESVSRNHARFVYLDGTLHVEDLDSMNGTWLDGEKLSANDQKPLRRTSDVEFGKIRLEVKEVDPA